MNVPPEVVEVLRQWVRKAEHDLEAANRIMAIEEGCPFDTVCFHCQQAAEKYLKCLLTYLGIQAPRTHDLKALAALIPLEQRFPVQVEDLAGLQALEIGRHESSLALALARAIMTLRRVASGGLAG